MAENLGKISHELLEKYNSAIKRNNTADQVRYLAAYRDAIYKLKGGRCLPERKAA